MELRGDIVWQREQVDLGHQNQLMGNEEEVNCSGNRSTSRQIYVWQQHLTDGKYEGVQHAPHCVKASENRKV